MILNIKIKYTVLICVLALSFSLSAQQNINSAGGNATDGTNNISYSVGQAIYSSKSNEFGTITQGVQFVYETESIVTTIDESKLNLSIEAFPNPATDYLAISINEYDFENMTYIICDLQGNILKTGSIKSNKTSILISDINSTIFIVKIIDASKEVATFKILKR